MIHESENLGAVDLDKILFAKCRSSDIQINKAWVTEFLLSIDIERSPYENEKNETKITVVMLCSESYAYADMIPKEIENHLEMFKRNITCIFELFMTLLIGWRQVCQQYRDNSDRKSDQLQKSVPFFVHCYQFSTQVVQVVSKLKVTRYIISTNVQCKDSLLC